MEEPLFTNPSNDHEDEQNPPPPPPPEVSGPEPLLNAEVYLAHGDRFAKFAAVLRECHLTVIHGFGYLKKHLKSRIVIDTNYKNWEDRNWISKD
jgi:hypothetical protein